MKIIIKITELKFILLNLNNILLEKQYSIIDIDYRYDI